MSRTADNPDLTLTDWLADTDRSRALLIEDGRAGGQSPLARWSTDRASAGASEVILIAPRPEAGLVRERDILAALHVALYPEDAEMPPTWSLAELRDQVGGGLRDEQGHPARVIALDRVNWAEASFGANLKQWIGRVRREQKVVVSLRIDDGSEPDVEAWYHDLGWQTTDALCLRMPAWPDGQLTPLERAQGWIGAGVTDPAVLDVLAMAMRPMSVEEIAAILGRDLNAVRVSLDLAPAGALIMDPRGRRAFADPAVAHAWAALRREAGAQARDRVITLGEEALRGESTRMVPYAIEHLGSLLFERGELAAQLPLAGEGWARAWDSLGGPLDHEADIARVRSVAERALFAAASAPPAERAAPILALFRCVQVSRSVMSRVPAPPDPTSTLRREPSPGHIADERAAALAGLADTLEEPRRTQLRERAIDALLAGEATLTEADMLVQLAPWAEGARRDAAVAGALRAYRADAADSPNAVWLLRAAPLLSPEARRALCDEVTSRMHELPSHDAAVLSDILRTAPPDVPPQLTQAIPALPQPDRRRLGCTLAPHLHGEARDRVVAEILEETLTNPTPLSIADTRSLIPALDAAPLSRLARALRDNAHVDDRVVGACLRALCTHGLAHDAEALAGQDPGVMPLDWVIALAAGSPARRSALGAELLRRLAIMDAAALGFTLWHHAAELVQILGAEPLIELARTIRTDEERILARASLVPFAREPEKRALIAEAVQAIRAPTGQEVLYWHELLTCSEWMSPDDACFVLVYGARADDALWMLKRFIPLLVRLGGPDLPERMAEQILDIGRWAP